MSSLADPHISEVDGHRFKHPHDSESKSFRGVINEL